MRRLCLILVNFFFVLGCGNESVSSNPEPASACEKKTAQILVLDGFLKHQCGCAETLGAQTNESSAFNCTVSSGTQVHFIYSASKLEHQIISSNQKFPDSALSLQTPVHVNRFDTAGTFPFKDRFSRLNGNIVVQ